jgi:SAM-dependent methyltransferase
VGKASRRKKARNPQDERRSASARLVDSYRTRLGRTSRSSNAAQLWAQIESDLGSDYASQLVDALNRRGDGQIDSHIYELLYRDLATVIATIDLAAPMAQSWLTEFALRNLPEGDLLDLGCGAGVYTCFYGLCRPQWNVVGVEVNSAGAARGAELARKLDLDNVMFVNADLSTVDLARVFPVVCSTAVLTELSEPALALSTPFSLLSSGRNRFQHSSSPLALAAARHLDPAGTYVSAERLSDFSHLAGWLGAQVAAGLVPDLSSTTRLSWSGAISGPESTPVTVAKDVGEPPAFEEVVDWWLSSSRVGPDLLAEVSLASSRDLDFIAGRHFDIRDDDGEGQTRLYLVTADDRTKIYMATSRGARSIVRDAPASASVVVRHEFNDTVAAVEASPQIRGHRELTEADLLIDLSR